MIKMRFTDQALRQDGWILAKFFFCMFIEQDRRYWILTKVSLCVNGLRQESRSIYMQKRIRPISRHLDPTSLVNNCCLVSSVGRAPGYYDGGRGFKPQTNPTLGILK